MTVAEARKTESTPAPNATNVARGLEGIIANTTRLSDVVGDKGQLIYAGYDIDDLAGKVSYKEVMYLLWKGNCQIGGSSMNSRTHCEPSDNFQTQ